MGSASSLPDDVRAHIAKYFPDREAFLAVRAAAPAGRDAAQRAIARRPGGVRRVGFYPPSAGSLPVWEPNEQPTECKA